MKFRFLSGDVNTREYGGKWISPVQRNGSFPYWLVIEAINMEDACGDVEMGRYVFTLNAVAPSKVNREDTNKAIESFGWEKGSPLTKVDMVEILHSYGITAPLWNVQGEDYDLLMQEAVEEADRSEIFFGFMMDRPRNGMGATGWDLIRGNVYGNAERKIKAARRKRECEQQDQG